MEGESKKTDEPSVSEPSVSEPEPFTLSKKESKFESVIKSCFSYQSDSDED